MGDTRDLWSAQAKRSGDGALAVPERRAERAKAGSRFACPHTPKLRAPQPNVAHPTVSSVNAHFWAHSRLCVYASQRKALFASLRRCVEIQSSFPDHEP